MLICMFFNHHLKNLKKVVCNNLIFCVQPFELDMTTCPEKKTLNSLIYKDKIFVYGSNNALRSLINSNCTDHINYTHTYFVLILLFTHMHLQHVLYIHHLRGISNRYKHRLSIGIICRYAGVHTSLCKINAMSIILMPSELLTEKNVFVLLLLLYAYTYIHVG